MNREADEEKAEVARLSSFVGAMAIGDLVKSTLGPKGMDKLLMGMGRNEGQVEVTNDGATILKAVGVDNPAAKILVNMSRVQDDEVRETGRQESMATDREEREHFMMESTRN